MENMENILSMINRTYFKGFRLIQCCYACLIISLDHRSSQASNGLNVFVEIVQSKMKFQESKDKLY